ncbi:hypothetical protein SAY86_014120 [Trapa natans]|uniref:Fungal lipase-type domain-containing protein n=1 Tax=Trapa natans TaxID=22666 RepID=A0AAN7KYJ7_TRANT|nr:hypothetical protein SAY86_014120 [Trapa natans]
MDSLFLMASSTVHSPFPSTSNLGLGAFCGGDVNHRPGSHCKRKLQNMPKKSACGSNTPIALSSISAASVSTCNWSCTSTSSIESMAPTMSIPGSCLPLLWREIQGCNDWEDLLDPLHPFLRDEIIRYGEFTAACYWAFDLDPSSGRYLNCKFGKKSILKEVGLGGSGYEVTKYIYATPDVNSPISKSKGWDSCTGRWIGYVAVSSNETTGRLGRRDVVITFRGTVTNPEWLANLMSSLTPARLDPHNPRPEVKVESGFLSLYTSEESACKFGLPSCREQLLSEVSRLLNMYKGENMSITLAGHSMGSSLALLLAYDISELGLNRRMKGFNSRSVGDNSRNQITLFSFGGPRVGNFAFKKRCEELGIKVLRIVNTNDPITKLPGVVFNENFRGLGGTYEFPWNSSCYAHVGVELALEFFNVQNPYCVHDLETYISLLKSPAAIQREDMVPSMHLLNKARAFLLSVPRTSTACNHGGM